MTASADTGHNEQDETIGNVLSSIRRILSDANEAEESSDDSELKLDSSMMVAPPSNVRTETAPSKSDAGALMAADTAAAAERSMDALHDALTRRISTPLTGQTVVSRASGVTIEDMVRAEVKDMVRTWLDAHLPSMVEIMVRAEIAKLGPKD